ncbi:MAG TPA: hypothetical protein VKS01_02505 [Bryobacteraceae bacterium]|nr:hypothetical protein [Bryobacteraceae bacterium]
MTRSQTWIVLAILTCLAVVAYLPALNQPFIDDDYPNIQLAQAYGNHGWHEMFADPIFRVRATTHVMLYTLHRAFDMNSTPYYAAMIALHVINTWLVFALGSWPLLGYRISGWAAGFFAIYEGHQEAIMWISGSTEPLLVLFGLAAFLCWLRRGWGWYLASLVGFSLALASKESAVIWLPLLFLPAILREPTGEPTGRFLGNLRATPHAILAGIAMFSIFATRAYSFRFSDGSFSLHSPFWITWPETFARLFWFWGALAVIAILILKPPRFAKILTMSLIWIGLALAPYSFLTYMHRIPSRQTYLASIGLSIIVGLALNAIPDRRALAIVCGLMIVHNVGYLWTKKRGQFLERAQPIEQLLDFATVHPGKIYMQCFPRQRLSAEAALTLMFPGRSKTDLVWDATEAGNAPVFCYRP